MDRETFEAGLKADGFEMREASMAPGTTNDEHTHPFDARLLILEGEITVAHEGQSQTCRAGDVFSLAAGVPHTETVGPAGVSYVAGRRET